eukprot:2206541-Rhodomonas_salina.1
MQNDHREIRHTGNAREVFVVPIFDQSSNARSRFCRLRAPQPSCATVHASVSSFFSFGKARGCLSGFVKKREFGSLRDRQLALRCVPGDRSRSSR